nr:glycosyltransferase family 25 protein [Acetobacter conturbans]
MDRLTKDRSFSLEEPIALPLSRQGSVWGCSAVSAPKTFVINLERHTSRLAAFFQNNPGLRDVEVFRAVDGWSLSRPDLIVGGIIAPDNKYVEPALGVLMSHLTLWRFAIEQNQTITILEDDVILASDFSPLTCELAAPQEEYDVIVWGANTDWPITVRPGRGLPETTLIFDPQSESGQTPPEGRTHTPSLLPLTGFAGISAYTITPQGAQTLFTRLLPIGNQPARTRYFEAGLGLQSHFIEWANSGLDVELNRQTDTMKFYLCFPFLAIPSNDWSTSSFTREAHTLCA